MAKQICQARQSERGFTLVELAIVMIIIGLLIGGILKGQELVTNARVTSTVNQVKGIDGAISTFFDQYAGLPGDILTPANRLPNCAGYCATAPAASDQRIQNATANDPTQAPGDSEGGRSFVQLAAAGILGGVDPTLAGYGPGAVPDTKVGTGKLTLGFSNGTGGLLSVAGNLAPGHYVTTNTNATTAIGTTNGVLTPKNAANIDRKLDDGAPNAGSVRSAGTGCNNALTPVGYAEQSNASACNLAIRVQQ